MNRINPELFAACFSSWVAECWPDKPDLVAIDGKTSRRSHDRKRGQKALHLLSAFATARRLVLGQEAADEKSNEDAKADYLLVVKDNQPTLHAEIKSYFDTAPPGQVERAQVVEKGDGRLEIRTHTVSHEVGWMTPERSYPGAFRFPKLTTIAMVESRIERGDKIETERRSYISSRILAADAVRSHWAIEKAQTW